MGRMANFRLRAVRRATDGLTWATGGRGPAMRVTEVDAGGRPGRLYLPEGGEDWPPVIFFHGGGFITGGLDSHDVVCRQLAAASGFRLLAVDYRLAPEVPAPAQLDDAMAACRWALSQPPELANSARIVVAGDSAGAYLAARCAMALNRTGRPVIAQLLLYPLLHLREADWARPAEPVRAVGLSAVRHIQRQLGLHEYPPILSLDVAALPPTVIASGRALDPVHADIKAFVERLKRSAVAVDWRVHPMLLHGALNLAGLSQAIARVNGDAGSRLWAQVRAAT
jgi:acetyl esterase